MLYTCGLILIALSIMSKTIHWGVRIQLKQTFDRILSYAICTV